MDTLLYWFVAGLIRFLQWLPIRSVARLGQLGGTFFYLLDFRHRRVALANLKLCFGHQLSPSELRALARKNFRRIGENFACAVKTASFSPSQLSRHVQFVGTDTVTRFRPGEHIPQRILSPSGPPHSPSAPAPPPESLPSPASQPPTRVVALGHFGNFELYSRFAQFSPEWTSAATFRGLPNPRLNQLLHQMRTQSGCLFFERRGGIDALKRVIRENPTLLGFLADQHAGRTGVRIQFLGHECSTTTAPAIFALRYRCPLFTAVCYRTGLAQWKVEVGPEIPTRLDGHPRPVADIMQDVNHALEQAVLRDPANWFWVHNRWKEPRGAPENA